MKPELVVDMQCHNAEGPLWHAQEGRLYWTDIPRGLMFRYDPTSDQTEQIYEGESVGGSRIEPFAVAHGLLSGRDWSRVANIQHPSMRV